MEKFRYLNSAMERVSYYANLASLIILLICWIVFAVRFFWWKKTGLRS